MPRANPDFTISEIWDSVNVLGYIQKYSQGAKKYSLGRMVPARAKMT